MSKENRGRPSEAPAVIREKFTQTFFEIPSKPELGYKSVWSFDRKINPLGHHTIEITYPKSHKPNAFKPEKSKAYGKQPVILVFKTSNRSNAKTKIKVFANENIDYILNAEKLVGIPENAVILECGVGKNLIEKYTNKYNLN
jgi:hypothetical protein